MYGRITSLENLKNHFSGGGNNLPYNTPVGEEYYISPNQTSPPERKANAAIVILGISSIFRFWMPNSHLALTCCPLNECNLHSARNTDLKGIVTSMKQMEDRFNKKFGYDYVFLNDQPFEDKFKQWVFYFY